MRKLSFLLIPGLLLLALLPSCRKVSGDGPVVTETRNVSGFSDIRSDFPGDIFLTPGNSYNVQIEAQQNIIDEIETVLSDGMLTLRVKHHTVIKPDSRVKVHITSPDIRGIIVSGSGSMNLMEALETPDLYLKVSGSGNISIPALHTAALDAHISGSGEIDIYSGTTGSESLGISGSGSMDFSGLQATDADVEITGSGNAKVHATGTLKVRISGSGSVYYRGSPSIDVNITGSGKLKPF